MENTSFTLTTPEQSEIQTKAENLIEQEKRAVIKSQADFETAADLTKFLNGLKKKADQKRTELVKPLNDTVKKINAEWKLITGPLEKAVASIKSKMNAFAREQEEIARKEREQAAKEAEERALAMAETVDDETADEILDQTTQAIDVAKHATKTVARGNFGSTAYTKRVPTWQIKDIRQIPLQYLKLDEPAIRQAIKIRGFQAKNMVA